MSALHEGLTEAVPAARDTEAAPAVSDTEVVPAASGADAGPVGGDAEAGPARGDAEAAPAARDARAAPRGGDTLVLPAISDAPGPALTPGPAPGAEPQPENPVGSRRYMDVEGTRAPVDDRLANSPFDYQRYATAAGPLARPRWDEPYQVQYRGIHLSLIHI